MVDPNSPAFNYAEKIGFVIVKGIRYIIVCGVVFFIGGKLGGSNSPSPVPNQPGVPSQPGPTPPSP